MPAEMHEPTAAGRVSVLAERLAQSGTRTPARMEAVIGLTRTVAQRSGLSRAAVVQACEVASLQDVGRLGLPPDALTDDVELSDNERYWIGQVPALGESLVCDEVGDADLGAAVRAQHERWDATGYPDRLGGEAIPQASRITHVCEAYVAMIADRPYRTSISPEAAVGLLQMASGTQFCPASARVLVELLQEPLPAELDAVPVAMKAIVPPRAPRPARDRSRRIGGLQTLAIAAVGGAIGAVIALPLKDVTARCPPAQEGQLMCTLQKAWAPALTTVTLCAFAAVVLFGLIAGAPAALRRFRAWRGAAVAAPPPFEQDARLAAASWGLTYTDVAGPLRKPVWHDEQSDGPR